MESFKKVICSFCYVSMKFIGRWLVSSLVCDLRQLFILIVEQICNENKATNQTTSIVKA